VEDTVSLSALRVALLFSSYRCCSALSLTNVCYLLQSVSLVGLLFVIFFFECSLLVPLYCRCCALCVYVSLPIFACVVTVFSFDSLHLLFIASCLSGSAFPRSLSLIVCVLCLSVQFLCCYCLFDTSDGLRGNDDLRPKGLVGLSRLLHTSKTPFARQILRDS